jgi:hypothetical protein
MQHLEGVLGGCNLEQCAAAKWLITSLSLQRPGINSRPDHMGFVVEKVALVQFFNEYFGFPAIVIPSLFRVHLSIADTT